MRGRPSYHQRHAGSDETLFFYEERKNSKNNKNDTGSKNRIVLKTMIYRYYRQQSGGRNSGVTTNPYGDKDGNSDNPFENIVKHYY